ncbi:MAG: ROK family transcriptional regulator [Bifidobacteriaceae bacterium]|jgi:predicted NBD/HSP70 family sugar kinase|nr:ROK family transcriptional regulator [Bifidobacteriaceae bacterium]
MPPTPPGSPRALREINAARILAALKLAGALPHAEIARRTGLSPASVTNIVRELTAVGAVEVADSLQDGRRCRLVSRRTRPGYVLGIDIGRTHLRACLADLGRHVIGESTRTMALGSPAEVGLELAEELLAEVVAAAGVSRDRLLAAGVGVPGPIHHATGTIGAGTLLPEWMGIDLPARFAQVLGVPTYVENDANLGALAEHSWRPVRESSASTLVYVRLATGIGSGIVVDGELYSGATGTAGEIGHVTVDENGPLCRCGNRGCLEAFAAPSSQVALLSSMLGRTVTVEDWVRMARAGSPAAVRLLEDMGHHIGAALANLCNLVNPDLVALGGPITAAGRLLLEPVRAEVRRRAIPAASEFVRIEVARHAERSAVFGAVSLALGRVEGTDPPTLERSITVLSRTGFTS